jgi:Zn-dependent protease
MPTKQGAIRLFRLFGITVYLHWTWFLAFLILTDLQRELGQQEYSSYLWNALEILCLFLIVLIHEFGHQLACRQVGGRTNDIVLWPLGGVAYVMPPQRPGAQLWSIAAGPLVNVILIPLLSLLVSASSHLGWYDTHPDLYELCHELWKINLVLLAFNLLPIYPLDGGQILRSLLWFPLGRIKSLMTASVIGLAGVAAIILSAIPELPELLRAAGPQRNAILFNLVWLGLMATFILRNCWGGFKQARVLAARAKMPRREGFACPSCHAAPLQGDLWRCGQCGKSFDIFLQHGQCPQCGTQFNATQCLECGLTSPIASWTPKLPVIDV